MENKYTVNEISMTRVTTEKREYVFAKKVRERMNNVSGISSSGARMSTDMQLKCQYLSEMP